MANKLILDGTAQTINLGFGAEVVGTAAAETVVVTGDADVSFTAGASDRVEVAGNLADFTVAASGNVLTLTSASGKVTSISIGAASKLAFTDGSVDVAVDLAAGGVVLGTTAVAADGSFDTAAVTTQLDATDKSTAGDGGTVTPTPTGLNMTTSSDLIQGTTGDDTINGLVGTNTANGNLADTFQSVDIIDGGAGNDTLNISIASATGAVGPTISNVENVVFTGFTNQAFNMANTTGVTSLTNKGSIVAGSFTNVGESAALTVENVNNQTTTLSYSASVNTTLTDTQTLNLNNATNEAIVTVTGNDIETLNIAATDAASKVDLGGTALDGTTTIAITGDQDLSFDDTDGANAMAAVVTVDASAYTGNLDADLRSSATNLAVTLGAGDDKLVVAGLTNLDVINTGAGSDTLGVLVADAETVNTAGTLSGVEAINFALNSDADDAQEDSTFNLAGATELTTIGLGATTAATKTNESQVTLTKVAATATTVNLNGDGAAVDTDLNDLVLSYNSTTGTSDSLTVNVTNTDANGNLINSTKGVQLNGGIIVNGVENLTLSTAQLHADTNATTQDGGLKYSITDDKLQKLTLVSETLLDLSVVALDGSVNTVDASAANGGVLLDMSAATDADTTATSQALTVTMGSGNDTITNFLGQVVTSTVTLGAGNDTFDMAASDFHVAGATVETLTIDAGAGNDTISLGDSTTLAAEGTIAVTTGDGVDTVGINGDGANQTGITIADFVAGSGGDKIDFTASTVSGMTGASSLTYVTALGVLDNGLNIVTAANAASLSTTDVAIALAGVGTGIIDANTGGDKNYIVIDDGTNAGIYEFVDAAGSAAIAAGELTLLVTLTGVTDVSTLNADNFTDFLA